MNNEEKNTYAKKQITKATLELLKENDLSALSISQITALAQVSRNAFYRNYAEKEEIIYEYTAYLLKGWMKEYEKINKDSNAQLYGSLFKHLSEHRDFYPLIKQRNLFHLFLKVMLTLFGPKPEFDNMAAYTTAFITYGTYGWIEEWLARGMQESDEIMTALLNASGMK